jgi:hypothetical protein
MPPFLLKFDSTLPGNPTEAIVEWPATVCKRLVGDAGGAIDATGNLAACSRLCGGAFA